MCLLNNYETEAIGFKEGACTGALIGGVAGFIAGVTYGYRLESAVSHFALAFK